MPRAKKAVNKVRATIRNRIVGHDLVDPHELEPHPLNWRLHPLAQKLAVGGSLEQLGWLREVLVNKRTGRVIDGHLRREIALERGEKVPVTYVDLDEEEEATALAILDPITAMAEADEDLYRQVVEAARVDDERVAEVVRSVLAEDASAVAGVKEEEPYYTPKLDPLIYEPQSEEPPPLEEVYDISEVEELQRRVDQSDLSPDLKAFLKAAAWRFLRIRYDQVAELYTHLSDPATRRLFEDLALVIVDHEHAIERGWLTLSEALAAEYDRVMGGEDAGA